MNANILVIEYEPRYVEHLREALAGPDFHLEIAGNMDDAVNLLRFLRTRRRHHQFRSPQSHDRGRHHPTPCSRRFADDAVPHPDVRLSWRNSKRGRGPIRRPGHPRASIRTGCSSRACRGTDSDHTQSGGDPGDPAGDARDASPQRRPVWRRGSCDLRRFVRGHSFRHGGGRTTAGAGATRRHDITAGRRIQRGFFGR